MDTKYISVIFMIVMALRELVLGVFAYYIDVTVTGGAYSTAQFTMHAKSPQ